ncbi:hypothetical protein RHGRI_013868 [Rhododendron griersonianum]|uniref:Major facilitator superfamily (MFS) profile domain-containing protein n=1 Tax=Rhododendron griersonianum TaxID=479676 RepID=A0AAV6K782_9ERIC|nr:hypothetical protein RHGRI_013868 [Rhododendron griersonianum]
MAIFSNALSSPQPSWFTPKRLLGIFCVINLINYVDRGAIASNGVNGSSGTCSQSGACTSGTGIQGDFNLNNFEDGVLSSAFMVGLLVASPIFASLAKRVNPFRLIGVGLSVWTFAAAGCGLSFDFWSITICRMLVGVGEASFISLAAPFIDDNAPVAQKTAWLAIFYMCIPAGVALGYVYGGLVGGYSNWRFAFFGEAILMFPFAVLGFVMKPLQLKGFSPVESRKALTAVSEVKVEHCAYEICEQASIKSEPVGLSNSLSLVFNIFPQSCDSTGKGGMLSMKADFVDQSSNGPSKSKFGYINLDELSRFLKDIKVLLLEKVYVVNVLGYIAYNFVIGAYSYWGPKAGYNIYHMTDADLIFGGLTIVCGILGTLAGGYVLDKMTATIPNAFKLLSVATLLGAAFCFTAFCFKSLYAFLGFFAIGELLVFATQGPVNYICLHCVKPSMRPIAMAMSTVSIHIFGDVPSSPLVGVFQDYVNNWRETALVLTSVLFLAAGIWVIGIFLPSVDRFDEESEHQLTNTGSHTTPTTPLLEEKTAEKTESSSEP